MGVYTGSTDGTVRVWDPETWALKSTVPVGGKVSSLLCARCAARPKEFSLRCSHA